MIISGKAKLAGVIGWPVGHSRSPRLHGYWLEKYKIDGAYLPLPIKPENLDEAFRALPKLGFSGINVTVPHKEKIFALVDELSLEAKRIGAVNTVLFREDGSSFGTNTDAFGFIENIKARIDFQPQDRPAVVIGAGGAARAVCVALQNHGVKEIRLVNRTLEKANNLAQELGGNIIPIAWDKRDISLDGAKFLVNSSSLGMQGQPELELNLDWLSKDAVVNDIVYSPLKPQLLQRAEARGNVIIDGLGMLLYQAQEGFRHWFGQKPEVTQELRDFVLGP